MDVPTQADLIEHIDRFLARHAMAETTFGREATGEPGLVSGLRDGRSPSLKMLHRLNVFIQRKDAERAEARAADHGGADSPVVDVPSAGNGAANSRQAVTSA